MNTLLCIFAGGFFAGGVLAVGFLIVLIGASKNVLMMPNERKMFFGGFIIFVGWIVVISVIVSWFAGYEFCKEKFRNGDYKVKIENVSVIVGK